MQLPFDSPYHVYDFNGQYVATMQYHTSSTTCVPSATTPVCIACALPLCIRVARALTPAAGDPCRCNKPFLTDPSANLYGHAYLQAACGLQTAKFNSTYVSVTVAQLNPASSLCGSNAFNISMSYSIGCAVPSPYSYHPYGVPTKDLVMMQMSALSIVSSNSTFDACVQSDVWVPYTLLFANPGNSTSGLVQCVPHTQSPTPPTTFSPTPPTIMSSTYRPTVFPTFNPTTAAQNALAVDFRSVPSPLVFATDPDINPVESLIYGAFETTLLTCKPSAATPACLVCDAPEFTNVTYSTEGIVCVSCLFSTR